MKNACIFELGCGHAEKTQALAKIALATESMALEVDQRQHEKT